MTENQTDQNNIDHLSELSPNCPENYQLKLNKVVSFNTYAKALPPLEINENEENICLFP